MNSIEAMIQKAESQRDFPTVATAAVEKLRAMLGDNYHAGILFVHRSKDRGLDLLFTNTDPRNLATALNAHMVSNGILPPGVPSDTILAAPSDDVVSRLRAELALAEASKAHLATALRRALPYVMGKHAENIMREALTHAPEAKDAEQAAKEQAVLDAAKMVAVLVAEEGVDTEVAEALAQRDSLLPIDRAFAEMASASLAAWPPQQ